MFDVRNSIENREIVSSETVEHEPSVTAELENDGD